jgi:vacuolar-type H+-ATPase subunit F/Vma7
MKAYLLGDVISIRLFALMGIEGKPPTDDPIGDLKELMYIPDAGIIFVTTTIANKIRHKAENMMRSKHPVIIEVPDIDNPQVSDAVIERIEKMLGS